MPTGLGRRLRRVIVAAATAGIASGVGAVAPATAPIVDWSSATAATSFVDGQVLVGFQPGVVDSDLLSQLSAGLGVGELRKIGSTHVLSVPHGQVLAKISQLQGIAGVRFAEPDYLVHADATPNDPSFANQWAWHNTGQTVNGTTGTAGADIKATAAWDVTTGSSNVVVAVQDTGFNYNHPDLQANAWSSNVSITENGVTCGAGTHGFRQVNGTPSCDPLDDDDHGSHVSGTIGAVGNNGVGVTGENWSVKIMGLKFLDSSGSGSTSDALACMDFAIKAKNAGVNLVAMNASWGNGTTFEQSMKDEINALGSAGILFVAAAGNSSSSTAEYPAGYGDANEISVAASDQNDNLASFSDFGSTVDLAAPGTNILSTVRSGYAYFQGTSMATPHVTGAAALLAASGLSGVAAIRAAIVNNVDLVPALNGKLKTNGRLDICKALGGSCNAPPPPPPPPPPSCGVVTNCGFESGMTGWTTGGQSPHPSATTTQAHSGSASAQVGANGQPEPNGDSWMYQTVTVPSSSPTLSFWYRPFTSDTITYDWQEVQIRNTSGGMLAQVLKVCSNSQSWTNVTYNMSAYAGQNVELWFNAHGDGYGDLTYMYVDDIGLSGSGPTAPGVPTGVSASPGNGSASLNWTAPNNNGATITSYTITPYIGTTAQPTTTVTGNPAPASGNATGLTNGTQYTFTVSATNSAGTSAASSASNAVMPWTSPGAPSAPQGLGATAGNQQVTLNWSAPALPGNSAITGYTVNWSGGPTAVSGGSATSTVITGLTDGTAYSFSVSAVNTQGTGPASNTASATPQAGPPGAPSGLGASATGQSGAVQLSWTGPADNGGSAIQGYTVSWQPGNGSTSASGSPFIVNGLANGTQYTFTVAAFNVKGTGPPSPSASATPYTTPGQPTNLQATPGNASVGLSWTPPNNGGSAITSYTVNWTWSSGSGSTSASGSPFTVTGLSNGTSYTFTVTAVNAAGPGSASASASATPVLSTNVVQNPGFESGLTSWTAGGAAPPSASSAQKHGGSSSAILGTPGASGHEPNGDSWLKQQIVVPTGSPQLSFWYRPQTTDSLPYDYQEAQIRDSSGNSTLAQVFKVCSNSQVWTQVTFNMSAYAGQTVTLYFNVHEDGYGDLTSMYLDDVSVQ